MSALAHAAYAPYVGRIGKPPGPMRDDYEAVVAEAHAFVVEERGDIVALLVLVDADEGLLLDNVAVRPDQRERGLGRRLVAFAEAEARRLGFPALNLYTHATMTENIAWYRRLGYRERRRVHEGGYDRVYMRKVLA